MTTHISPDRLAELDFYPVWQELPELETAAAIDPFDFRQRMAIYRLLIETTSPNGIFGAQCEYNVFWGYIFQLYWQWRSGRLRQSTTPVGRIDPNSVWCFGNYSLNIIPLIAAMQVGFTPEKTILLPNEPTTLPYVGGGGQAGKFQIPPLYDKALSAWRDFFQMLTKIKPGSDLEPVRFDLWKAHYESLIALEHVLEEEGLKYTSRQELDFLIGWTHMVDFLGAAAWRTDLPYMLENGVGWLPERPLTDEDIPGKAPDMDEKVNNNVKSIIGLTRQAKWQFNFNLWLWKRAMRSRQARDEVLPMLDATFNPSPANVKERRKLLRYMLGF
ncbi:MAG TPA: Leg1-related protein [Phototrophicaceae bacterium]|jgi:hypothetical protein|nr:Leg1-related protein [Phototrophicaceae bacterium]